MELVVIMNKIKLSVLLSTFLIKLPHNPVPASELGETWEIRAHAPAHLSALEPWYHGSIFKPYPLFQNPENDACGAAYKSRRNSGVFSEQSLITNQNLIRSISSKLILSAVRS